MKRKLGLAFLILLVLIFVVLSYRWIKERRDYAITDAVFVRSEEMTNLSFQVSGKVINLQKDLGDEVKAGEILANLDDTDYRLNLKNISAQLESLKAQREALSIELNRSEKETSLSIQAADIASQEITQREKALLAQLEELRANKEKAYKDLERFESLYKKGLIPLAKYEEVKLYYQSLEEKHKALKANLEEVKLAYTKSLKEAQKVKVNTLQVEKLKKQVSSMSKEIEALEAQRELLHKQLEYTQLKAPFDGVVARRFVSTGDMVRAGQPIYAIIKKDSLYLEVLLEEDKLRGVGVGSKVIFRPDAFKGIEFTGKVVQISPASAATFALVPRDVSAGEFTKVVQRIPIKVKLTKGPIDILRVGMGGKIKIERLKNEPR